MWGGSVPMFCMSCSICSGLCIGLLCAACACSAAEAARAQQKHTQPCSHIADTLSSRFLSLGCKDSTWQHVSTGAR